MTREFSLAYNMAIVIKNSIKNAASFFIVLLTFVAFTIPGATAQSTTQDNTSSRPKIRFHEFGVLAGYNFSELKPENHSDFAMIPVMFRFGFDTNDLLGLNNHKGTAQVILEPFAGPAIDPHDGLAAGLNVLLQYSYPLGESLAIYGGAGTGPMYLDAETYEQDGENFNFFDQAFAGVYIFVDENKAINLGYRKTHISNLGIAGHNSGINSDMFVAGISLFY